MAKLNDDQLKQKRVDALAKAREAKAAKKAQEQEENAQPTSGDTDAMKAVLERLERLESENKELKEKVGAEKVNPFKKGREHYKWPRTFSYRLWGTVPILSAETFRKDPTRDLLYKNANWVWITNHYVKLKLANDQEVEVVIDDYNRDFLRSEKLEAKDQHGQVITEKNLDDVQSYTFETKDYWTITVLSSVIN